MKHLLVCPEFPPAPGGGIGTYAERIAGLFAERGEVVHVIARGSQRSTTITETHLDGRLTIHRLPSRPAAEWKIVRAKFPRWTFGWQAGLLAERLVADERIDIVEAQEYGAPLYWFQRRRSSGAGPAHKPPCIIHLHSPTSLIARHNDDRMTGHLLAQLRKERYSIRSADALLCPGHELARWAGRSSRSKRRSVTVIPLPGPVPTPLERTRETWSTGTVCYVGRLETRKGVVEWVDAAVKVAGDFADQKFDFVGADCPGPGGSMRRRLEARIPARFRDRFRFSGPVARTDVWRHRSRARIAVVPSRWDNFPNVCVEAMSSGLPVIATSTGALREMVRQGRSGWLAQDASSDQLSRALRAALSSEPDRLAEMGKAATSDIQALTDPDVIFAEHMRMRNELAS